jgi:ribosomal protein L7Ae-like RNA K-turn-binding protein
VLDYRQQLPGRGLYTCLNRQCLGQAVKKNSFRRVFGGMAQPVELAELHTQLQQALIQRIKGLILMARKAGQLIAGSNMVLDALKGHTSPAVVVMATDIADNMKQKIESTATRQQIVCTQLFDKVSLGQMLGKVERSVIAIQDGALATLLNSELHRYELVREN